MGCPHSVFFPHSLLPTFPLRDLMGAADPFINHGWVRESVFCEEAAGFLTAFPGVALSPSTFHDNSTKGQWAYIHRDKNYESVGRFVPFPIGLDTPEMELDECIGAAPPTFTTISPPMKKITEGAIMEGLGRLNFCASERVKNPAFPSQTSSLLIN